MLTCMSRLFLEVGPNDPARRKMLPLKQQQEAFESVYLKAQEGMGLPVSECQRLRSPWYTCWSSPTLSSVTEELLLGRPAGRVVEPQGGLVEESERGAVL